MLTAKEAQRVAVATHEKPLQIFLKDALAQIAPEIEESAANGCLSCRVDLIDTNGRYLTNQKSEALLNALWGSGYSTEMFHGLMETGRYMRVIFLSWKTAQ